MTKHFGRFLAKTINIEVFCLFVQKPKCKNDKRHFYRLGFILVWRCQATSRDSKQTFLLLSFRGTGRGFCYLWTVRIGVSSYVNRVVASYLTETWVVSIIGNKPLSPQCLFLLTYGLWKCSILFNNQYLPAAESLSPSRFVFNSLELWETLYECLKNVMDVDRLYIQHTHKDTPVSNFSKMKMFCFFPHSEPFITLPWYCT